MTGRVVSRDSSDTMSSENGDFEVTSSDAIRETMKTAMEDFKVSLSNAMHLVVVVVVVAVACSMRIDCARGGGGSAHQQITARHVITGTGPHYNSVRGVLMADYKIASPSVAKHYKTPLLAHPHMTGPKWAYIPVQRYAQTSYPSVTSRNPSPVT